MEKPRWQSGWLDQSARTCLMNIHVWRMRRDAHGLFTNWEPTCLLKWKQCTLTAVTARLSICLWPGPRSEVFQWHNSIGPTSTLIKLVLLCLSQWHLFTWYLCTKNIIDINCYITSRFILLLDKYITCKVITNANHSTTVNCKVLIVKLNIKHFSINKYFKLDGLIVSGINMVWFQRRGAHSLPQGTSVGSYGEQRVRT